MTPLDRLAPRFAGASLLNLAASIGMTLGCAPRHAPLADARVHQRIVSASTLVVWLIDGLGVEPLQSLVPHGALAGQMAGEAEALFPSSTAPTLTTLTTGLSVAEHGVPEWFLHFEELGEIYRALPLDPRDPASSAPRLDDAGRVYDWRSAFAGTARPVVTVQPARLATSTYSRRAHQGAVALGYAGDEELVARVLEAVDGAGRGGLVYVYEDRFDQTCHAKGVASAEAERMARRLDAVFARLAEALHARGASLLVTADHGFIDPPSAERLRLEDYPRVASCLARPLCGGPRVPLMHLRPGCERDFEQAAAELLGAYFACVPAGALVERGWFGPGKPHPRLRARLGDYVLVPTGHAVLVDRLPAEPPWTEIGVHGGCSSAERRVPLILN
ncbi:MAG: hypothetical protein RL669_940 [Pseudomonadota bacterium]